MHCLLVKCLDIVEPCCIFDNIKLGHCCLFSQYCKTNKQREPTGRVELISLRSPVLKLKEVKSLAAPLHNSFVLTLVSI